MTGRRLVFVVVLAALGLPSLAWAQGLGDTAAREKARREKEAQAREAPAAPVYTDHDLEVYRPAGSDSDSDSEEGEETSESGGSSEEGEARRPSPPLPDRAGNRRPLQDEVYRARERVSTIEAQINRLNGRLNPMSRDYVYGQAGSGDAAGEELRVKAELADLQRELAQARQELAEATTALNQAGGRGRGPAPDEEE